MESALGTASRQWRGMRTDDSTQNASGNDQPESSRLTLQIPPVCSRTPKVAGSEGNGIHQIGGQEG